MKLEEFEHKTDVARQEFRSMADTLANRGLWLNRLNATLKVIIIILGALTAAKGTYGALFENDKNSSLFFATIGILVAVITGVEAAFKVEKKSFELFKLSDQCSAFDKKFSVEFQKVKDISELQKLEDEMYIFLNKMNNDLQSVYSASSNAGFNLIPKINKINKRLMAERKARVIGN